MTPDKDTTIVPQFSEEIFLPLRFLPKGDDKATHSIRCTVLQNALNAYFFGGRMFIFKPTLFHITDQWRDKATNRPLMLVSPEPAALGFESTEAAIKGVETKLCEWG